MKQSDRLQKWLNAWDALITMLGFLSNQHLTDASKELIDALVAMAED